MFGKETDLPRPGPSMVCRWTFVGRGSSRWAERPLSANGIYQQPAHHDEIVSRHILVGKQ